MAIYIVDEKKHTVRHYFTKSKIEKAIETLLKTDEELLWSETYPGYKVDIVDDEGYKKK